MSKPQFESFVSKYLYEPEFKALLQQDARAALGSIGITVTPQIRATLDSLQASGQLDNLAKLDANMAHNFVGLL